MKFFSLLSLACLASAHTTFTTLFIDGKDQGDGTCVRMPHDPETATYPIHPIDGSDMACGRDGATPVNYVCPASKASLLTFEWRLWPDYEQPGSIDPGHLGPCAVYMKQMDSLFSNQAAGPGWFKVWEDGYSQETQKWCVDTLIQNNGLLSVRLPRNLPSGSYLIRPEILALHAATQGDPQFYVGCAQIFIQSDVGGPLVVPDENSVSIPGYVNADTPGLTYNIYENKLPPYLIPGPKVFIPSQSQTSSPVKKLVKQTDLKIPSDCLVKNANWCGKPLPRYQDNNSCWASMQQCYQQSKQCYGQATPAGSVNCKTWEDYCQVVSNACNAGSSSGPPSFVGSEESTRLPGPIPQPWNDVFEKKSGAANGNGPTPAPEKPDDAGTGRATTRSGATTSFVTVTKTPSSSPPPSANCPSSVVLLTSYVTVTITATATATPMAKH